MAVTSIEPATLFMTSYELVSFKSLVRKTLLPLFARRFVRFMRLLAQKCIPIEAVFWALFNNLSSRRSPASLFSSAVASHSDHSFLLIRSLIHVFFFLLSPLSFTSITSCPRAATPSSTARRRPAHVRTSHYNRCTPRRNRTIIDDLIWVWTIEGNPKSSASWCKTCSNKSKTKTSLADERDVVNTERTKKWVLCAKTQRTCIYFIYFSIWIKF